MPRVLRKMHGGALKMGTVGCDPELVLRLTNGGVVSAEDLLGSYNTNTGWGGFGADGAGTPAEIRPSPSRIPAEVVSNAGCLLQVLYNAAHNRVMTNDYLRRRRRASSGDSLSLEVGSDVSDIPVGGHIHLGTKSSTRFGLLTTKEFDILMCPFLMTLVNLSDFSRAQEREGSGYGHLFDTRTSEYSKEFRFPSSDWLATPSLAEAVLTLVGEVASGILSRMSKISYRRLPGSSRGQPYDPYDIEVSPTQLQGTIQSILDGTAAPSSRRTPPPVLNSTDYLDLLAWIVRDQSALGIDWRPTRAVVKHLNRLTNLGRDGALVHHPSMRAEVPAITNEIFEMYSPFIKSRWALGRMKFYYNELGRLRTKSTGGVDTVKTWKLHLSKDIISRDGHVTMTALRESGQEWLNGFKNKPKRKLVRR